MHTKTVTVGDDTYHLHHNGDFSGDVTITQEGKEDIQLPGEVMVALGRYQVADSVVTFLEQSVF